MGAGALGGAENGPQIVGIRQLVADDNQRILTPGGGLLQNVVDGVIGMGGSQGNHALMAAGVGHQVQLPAVHGNHHGPGLPGLGGQPLQALVRITGGDKELVDGPSRFQRLSNGVAALQLVFVFLHRLGADRPGIAFGPALEIALGTTIGIVHGFSSVCRQFFRIL